MKSDKYLLEVNPEETDAMSVSLRNFAKDHDIPIVTYEGLNLLKQIILLRDVKRMLEIGTAIGYTSINIALFKTDLDVVTIERKADMVNLARRYIHQTGLAERITLIEGDALTLPDSAIEGSFDLIFIDAAKAQSIKFFEKFEKRLNPRGVIVTDNVLFHGLIKKGELSRSLRQLVRKIDDFNHYLKTRTDYYTVIHPIGDGMSISVKLE